jgi:hypothetical protein
MTDNLTPAGRAQLTGERVAEVMPSMQVMHAAVSDVLRYAGEHFESCRSLPGWSVDVPQTGGDLVALRRWLRTLNHLLLTGEGLGRVLVFEAVRHADNVMAAATRYVNGWCDLSALTPGLTALTSYARDLCKDSTGVAFVVVI